MIKHGYLLDVKKAVTLINDTYLKKIKKENLPSKLCIVCKKPFTWRKKWEKVWDEVKYCSDKCRMNKNLL